MLQWVKQRGRKSAAPAAGRATLAVFGKHPGWDDHMPDIGVDTEVLATLKQNIYVVGIGGQIDSGAWERLDAEKRMDGFDHLFLWVKRADVVLGQLWSSSDRKGRSKYPMGVCVHLENLPLESITDTPRALLDQVRDACKATHSADHVVLECRTAQDQLNHWLAGAGSVGPRSGTDPEQKRRFLQDPAFQPDFIGLLRVLHELDNATGRSHLRLADPAATTELRSYQIRVPSGTPNTEDALLLWATFLRCALPETIPLLLIARHGTDWVDIIIGRPTGDSLFCLQAPLKAVPLVTAIPYDIAPELGPRLQALTAQFLGSSSKSAAAQTGQAREALAHLPDDVEKGPGGSDVARRSPIAIVGGALALALLCGGLALWLRSQPASKQVEQEDRPAVNEKALAVRPTAPLVTESPGPGKVTNAPVIADQAKRKSLEELLAAGLGAGAEKQWSQATNLSAQAVRVAADLKDQPNQLSAQHQFDFANDMASAESLLRDGKPDEARQRAADALKLEPGNAAASEFLKIAGLKQGYDAAVREGQAALDKKDYALAMARASAALEIKPDDAPASQMKLSAQRELAFQTALQAAQNAFSQGDFPEVIHQADAALREKKDDLTATILKQTAESQLAKGQKEKELQGKYQEGLSAGRLAYERGDYSKAAAQAEGVLSLRPKDPEAIKLKSLAQQEQGYLAATMAFTQGDYSKALGQCQPYQGTERFDRLAQQIGQEQSQLGAVQKALAEGSYGAILTGALPGKAVFETLKASASEENRALQQASQRLAAGDYGFIDILEQQSYRTKPPFLALLETGRKERETLKALRNAREVNDRQAVREKISKLAGNVRSKEPFAGLERWATIGGPSAVQATASPSSPASGNIAHLENILRALEIRFGIKEADPAVKDRDGNPVVRETSLSNAKRTEASAKVHYLEEYRNDGWLSDDRKARLQKLDDAIRNWKE